MGSKASNFSDLIQRATVSCLLSPICSTRHGDEMSDLQSTTSSDDDETFKTQEEEDNYTTTPCTISSLKKNQINGINRQEKAEGLVEMETLIGEVFEAVSAMKKAYVSLQDAHCPWDPDKMRVADVTVVSELKRLGVLRERYRRNAGGGMSKGNWKVGTATLREVVAPYEAVVEELKSEVKAKEVEIENLTEKLQTASSISGSGGSGGKRNKSKKKMGFNIQVSTSPPPELFESTMSSVKDAAKSFTSLLLSLMRSAHWDISAAVRSIEASSSSATTISAATNGGGGSSLNSSATTFMDSIIGVNHAKYALESYVNRKMFQGFDHETFYMDGTLSSLINPEQYRRDCFTQYRDMKAMDPIELLGILPTCSFGKFCFKKYLAIVHPKMEESLFGDLEQRRQVLAGTHPRTQFYAEFSGLAKVVWLLHLLAFSMDPLPSLFEASKGAEFHPQYMDNVVRLSSVGGSGGNGGSGGGGRIIINGGAPQFIGFPVTPGFKLGNGSIIKARVYLVSKNNGF